MAEAIYKASPFVPKVNRETRVATLCISAASEDRDKEYIEPDAFLEDLHFYQENPVLLLGHMHKTLKDSLPIGKGLKFWVDGNKFFGDYYIASTQVGEDVLTLLEEGILRGTSAGFIPRQVINNPQDSQLPNHVRGKGIKKRYMRVELVEVSLLAIPSNRDGLVAAVEKGNQVANYVLKDMDGEDVSLIVKEWLQEEEDKNNIDLVIKEWLQKEQAEKPVRQYTLKDLWSWREEDHPRDNDGMFTSKPSSLPNIQEEAPRWSVCYQEVCHQLFDLEEPLPE